MDRSEHEQTYDAFLTYTKHSIVVLTAILCFCWCLSIISAN